MYDTGRRSWPCRAAAGALSSPAIPSPTNTANNCHYLHKAFFLRASFGPLNYSKPCKYDLKRHYINAATSAGLLSSPLLAESKWSPRNFCACTHFV